MASIPFNQEQPGSAAGGIQAREQVPVRAFRTDEEAIDQAFEKFERWAETGASVFTLDDYAILFQAGTFEYHKNAEDFAAAVYRWGTVPGPRTEK